VRNIVVIISELGLRYKKELLSMKRLSQQQTSDDLLVELASARKRTFTAAFAWRAL
jgi:hypothetical protein